MSISDVEIDRIFLPITITLLSGMILTVQTWSFGSDSSQAMGHIHIYVQYEILLLFKPED